MMWNIVQAKAAAALALLACVGGALSADLVIEIPGAGGDPGLPGGRYRLDYRPPDGSPAPNFTVPARASTINFQGLPGTKYHFMLYYSNATFADLLTWNQTIVTAPEPPSNLTVTLARSKAATIAWAAPAHGDYSGFRFRVAALGEGAGGARNLSAAADERSLALRELQPGGTYQLHAFTLLNDKESAAYASTNFTTKPNTPGKFIVWFRNETTLLVLWQPPYPPGQYTHYKVSIVPGDARDSELYVEKEGEPPGPAQAAFKGLVPGRAYNISVQTVSEPAISAPTTAQYRTVPLRPHAVRLDAAETSLDVRWEPPQQLSEFEKYQVSVVPAAGGARRSAPLVLPREEPPHARFDGLDPGARYTVTVKTMSGKVTSWPQSAEVTLKPLPVRALTWRRVDDAVLLAWEPSEHSTQDSYRVSYQEVGEAREDSAVVGGAASARLDALLPGRNYSVGVAALAGAAASAETHAHVLTPPRAPALREAAPLPRGLRLAWGSDVDSKQDEYVVEWRRAEPPPDSDDWAELRTKEPRAEIQDLLPGGVYELRLSALSHGERSAAEAPPARRCVPPLPPRAAAVERATSNSAVVRWRGPPPAASHVSLYVLRYRTGDGAWSALRPLRAEHTEAEIVDMVPGERYTVQLDAACAAAAEGERLESGRPVSATHTVRPNPVSNVAPLADTRNVTLEWPRPEGRVERYIVSWRGLDSNTSSGERGIPADAGAGAGAGADGDGDGDGAAGAGAGAGAGPVRVQLGGLWPGARYRVSVAALSYNLSSDVFTMDIRTRPLIQSEMTIVTESEDEDDKNATEPALLVVYTRTPPTATTFDAYRFRLEGGGEGGEPREETRAAAAAPRRLAFRGLVPGRLYNVTMSTLAGNVSSHPVTRAARLFPRPPTELAVTGVEARRVSLAWRAPPGDYTDFLVQWTEAGALLARAATEPRLDAGPLRPHTRYTFTVEARAGGPASLLTRSRAVSVEASTAQAPPGKPVKFEPVDSTPSSVSFSWELPPADEHGVLTRWEVSWGSGRAEYPGAARTGAARGLRAGELYEFSLRAETIAGPGDAVLLAVRTPIGAPPRPAAAARPLPARRSPTALAVRFRADYFSCANGNVTAYTLVLGEAPLDSPAPRLPSWRDVQRLPVWPPYQVTEPYYPFHSSSVEEFTIGSERCDAGGRAYCNGPLKPSTKYYVKLRAFTAPDKFTDTAYTVVYTEADHTAWYAGGAALAAACALGAGALLLRRRRRPAPPPPPSRPVRAQDFLDHYRLMAADSDFRFSEEFEELKHVGREQPCSAADLPVNRPKNRFTNILPYDHSRFKLQPLDDEEGSDYINANYVGGYSGPREYIVTQGPLHCTRDDFWRMCWESGARHIVMLTRCVEKGREKCDRYWPDTRPAYYGDICVSALNESRYPDWTLTELAVSRGGESRPLLHLHFTTWPDFGVPAPATALVRFVRAFRERVHERRPVVVHCSAGVGRSGTFVALDRLLQALDARAPLDVFGAVHALRRDRVWMVQTEQQYICIHQCLVAVLEGQELAPPHPLNHHLNQAYEDDEGIAESGM